ncbi:hypothetical protein E2C01_019730 [Portunus trituberculatus]|uniref:Uncharacterized protein n=1 Tax=Portunus trituberculatus TaxID=210409 RepID=A0A5B7DYR2_PORTR|nr:hypothetical protein [Portunus trituberculatus]
MTVDRIRTRALGDPSAPRARVVPLIIKQARPVSKRECGEAVAARLGKVSSPRGMPTAPAR